MQHEHDVASSRSPVGTLLHGFAAIAFFVSTALHAEVSTAANMVRVGELELVPNVITLRMYPKDRTICLDPTVRFTVTNRGVGQVKLGLIAHQWQATDSFGLTLYADRLRQNSVNWDSYISASGISNLSKGTSNQQLIYRATELTVLSPDQSIDVQVRHNRPHCVPDEKQTFTREHRPESATISGQLLVVDVAENEQRRGFSFSDVPVRIAP